MTLGLMRGRTWRRTPGPLVLKTLTTQEGGDPLHLAHGTGIVVADVVADPAISVSRAPVTATTTRRVSIRGSGFDLDGVVVQLEPTWASAFEVEQVFADEIVRVPRRNVSFRDGLGRGQRSPFSSDAARSVG